MRVDRRHRCAASVQQISRHAEVNQENATGLEPNNQILATAIDRDDSLAFQLCGHSGGVERAGEARIVDLDALETPTHQERLEPCSHGLDLGQLGHGASLAGLRWTRPGGATSG
jgi:hypothetical protein